MDAARTGDENGESVSRRNLCFEIKDGVPISTFDLSTENFLAAMEATSELCDGTRGESFEASEIERFKSMVVFLREWKQFYFGEWMPFHYNSKTINFAYETDSAEVKHAINGINLPLFSSAAVPKVEKLPCIASAPDNDDFVLHVGGSVWALDWCPRLHENTGCDAKVEYLAVSAHPTGSEYHKIGEQLSGRGAIQIWCFLHLGNNDELPISGVAHRRGRPRSLIPASPPFREVHDSEAHVMPIHDDCPENATVTNESAPNEFFIPNVIALPRLVLSLAHNGKVVWDMKWRPSDAVDSKGKRHMGYLAVLLGNGSLEVWEVPVHGIVSLLYAACHIKGADPRFLKLQPVFRCSRVNFGDRQSIPFALEWSPSASRDLILAGCHDGTVALWKFSSQHSSQDTKPFLCFTADSAPIRSLAWAPNESDTDCSNLIVTAGHEGLKFWDLRDPYRPLWDLCPVHKAVLGLDWLKDPRCIVIAYEDGMLRTLSLTRIANDMPVTGETLVRAKQQGVHSRSCSSFAIWSVQVSRSIGLVAYCSSDGRTRCFQLTEKAVDKDASRYRKPHFTCGSLIEEGQAVRINTPFTGTPLPKQTFVSKKVVNEATPTNSATLALCWHEDNKINFNSGHKKRKGNPRRVTETREDEGTLQCIQDKGDEARLNILKFPPKSVALHKVRWNMNKGSGRWLCYGGAAGIVRCQVVSSK